eukprot:UN12785
MNYERKDIKIYFNIDLILKCSAPAHAIIENYLYQKRLLVCKSESSRT